MDVLVVLIVAATVVAAFLPALRGARERARTAVCLDNLRQAYAALDSYSRRYDGYMPPMSYGKGKEDFEYSPLLYELLAKEIAGADDDGSTPPKAFGHALDCPDFRAFLPCPVPRPPSDKVDARFPGRPDAWTYGANYPAVFGHYMASAANEEFWNGSAKLARVPRNVFLLADTKLWTVSHPDGSNGWNLAHDTDGDGQADSSFIAQYQGFVPAHGGGGHFLFPDGRVEWHTPAQWAANENGLWGRAGNAYKN
jgi:prepilin-type processing-associated H-X9-DG protein